MKSNRILYHSTIPKVVYAIYQEKTTESAHYFDPLDTVKPTMGKALHLEMSTTLWLDQLERDINPFDEIIAFLASLSPEELFGRDLPFDIHGYVVNARAQAIRAKHKKLTDEDI